MEQMFAQRERDIEVERANRRVQELETELRQRDERERDAKFKADIMHLVKRGY
jgi:F0F1-type ATP synthase epsilon subunit